MTQAKDRTAGTDAAETASLDDLDVSSEVVIEPGALLEGKYLVAAQLGAGGMGVVYLAHDRLLERDVAIKVLSPLVSADVGLRARFKTEARAMARVRHENVVSIFSFGVAASTLYFVMEYVPGMSVAHWLERNTAPSPDEALGLFRQVCRGVQAIHDAGATHHDIKPANILIGPAFRVAVTDLGLARLSSSTGKTGYYQMVGTPDYMAPEQIRGERLTGKLAPSTDVYQLGVLAYELLTGRVPFVGQSLKEVLDKHVAEAPLPPSDLRSELAAAFDAPILAALAKHPADRPASARALSDALEAARGPGRAPASVRLLVADDDADFLQLATRVLAIGFPGAKIHAVQDGAAALEALDRAEFDLALLDLQMPGLTGLEVAASVLGQARRPKLVIMTGVGGPADWRVLREMGADAFLLKPLEPDQIVSAVRRALGVPSLSP